MQFARYGDVVQAMQVIPRSPAARAGVREGDTVSRIDGRAASDWTPEELQRLFEDGAVGRSVTIEVVRGGGVKTLRFKLAELL